MSDIPATSPERADSPSLQPTTGYGFSPAQPLPAAAPDPRPQTGAGPWAGAAPGYGPSQPLPAGAAPGYGPSQPLPAGAAPGYGPSQPLPAGAAPGYGPAQQVLPPAATRRPLRPASSIVAIVFVIVAVVSTYMPWNENINMFSLDGEGPVSANAWDQMIVNIDNGRFYGILMLISLLLTVLASLLVLCFTVVYLFTRSKSVGNIVIIVAVLGLAASGGMISGYAILGAMSEGTIYMVVFGLSFIPVVAASIGMRSGTW